MYSTTSYLFQQITQVLLVSDSAGESFTFRYNPVYAKILTINKGVDNVLLFEFINQEEKPVNITGSSFIFRVINQAGDQILVNKQMTILSAVKGRVKVVLSNMDVINIAAQPASYSIQRTQGDYVQAAFVDSNSGARAGCNIVDSVLPQFIPSFELTIPTIYGTNQSINPSPAQWPLWALQPQPNNARLPTSFYSSHIPTNGQRQTTVKFDLDHYTGTIKFQAADDYQAIWYNVTESATHLDATGVYYLNIQGYYPLLRMALDNSIGRAATASATVSAAGVVESIQVTNPGAGFVAAPKIQIFGDGAGATAEATISNGQVSSIIVTSGGSGYFPIQYQSGNNAVVYINNGYVINLQYR